MEPRREELTPKVLNSQAPIRTAKAPRVFRRNLNATEAIEFFGFDEKHLYWGVQQGIVTAVKERHYGYTVYPEWELERLALVLGFKLAGPDSRPPGKMGRTAKGG